jgi:hypothetical protein
MKRGDFSSVEKIMENGNSLVVAWISEKILKRGLHER